MTTNTAHTYYTVKSGDTLTAIAASFTTTVDQLVEWNGIPDRNHIEVGQELIVETLADETRSSAD
ncbi:LysM peptidoglycan-binding domain-containing protein [Streptomyces sp. NPDC017993]|uniref:LysM peptidoglycan-binding domain-containing protein n=1 Tax=Streptomyces sp. NPDC017993 TaxID=3365027 RepID=UPI0037A0BDD5